MSAYATDDAICLRVTDFSETSQIVALFTRAHGLVRLIAKGSKRSSPKSAFSGPLDLLTSGQVVFIPARDHAADTGGAQLATLTGWELANHRRALRTSLQALHAAMLCAEITAHLVHPYDPHPQLFDELEAALDLLETAHHPRAALAYAKAALVAAGYWPRLTTCLACGKPVADAPLRFSPAAGGVLCGSSARDACQIPGAGATITVPGRILLALDRLPLPTALRDAPPERAADESALRSALQLLLAHIESITDKPLRTRSLLSTIFTSHKA